MQYEVEIRVRATGPGFDEIRSFRQSFEFGDDRKYAIAGEEYCVEATAAFVADRIREDKSYQALTAEAGYPRPA
jgi:hypothetical protein